MNDSPKMLFFLIALGTIVGIACGGLVGLAYTHLSAGQVTANQNQPLTQGAQFKDLNELRQVMTQNDSRDVKNDGSVSLRSIIQPHSEDSIIYELRSNLDVKFQGVSVKTNSCGMRDREYSLVKPEGVYRILLLGDSFAFGWGVEEEKSFAKVLERTLNKFTQGQPRVEVLNFAVPGYSTFQEVAQFYNLASDFKPDSVLVYLVDNDFYLPFFINNFAAPGQVALASEFSALKRSVHGTEEANKPRRLLGMLSVNKALEKLANTCRDSGVNLFLAINPNRSFEKVIKKLRVLRKRPDILPLYLREDYLKVVADRGLQAKELSLVGDPHPNAKKHKILGQLLALEMLPHLEPQW